MVLVRPGKSPTDGASEAGLDKRRCFVADGDRSASRPTPGMVAGLVLTAAGLLGWLTGRDREIQIAPRSGACPRYPVAVTRSRLAREQPEARDAVAGSTGRRDA